MYSRFKKFSNIRNLSVFHAQARFCLELSVLVIQILQSWIYEKNLIFLQKFQEQKLETVDKVLEEDVRLRSIKTEVGQLVALAAGKLLEEDVSDAVCERLYEEMMAQAGERE